MQLNQKKDNLIINTKQWVDILADIIIKYIAIQSGQSEHSIQYLNKLLYSLFVGRVSSNILFLESIKYQLLQSNEEAIKITNQMHQLSEEIVSMTRDVLINKKNYIFKEATKYSMQQNITSLFTKPTEQGIKDKIALKSALSQIQILENCKNITTCHNRIASLLSSVTIAVGIPAYKLDTSLMNSFTKALEGMQQYCCAKKETVLLGVFYHNIPDNSDSEFIEQLMHLLSEKVQNCNMHILLMSTGFDNQKKSIIGKGNNIRNFFDVLWLARCSGSFKAGAMLDGDLRTSLICGEERGITNQWVKNLLYPIICPKDYKLPCAVDFVCPLYPKHGYDSNLTNNFVAPMYSLITGASVRQPIGGDFGFSAKALEVFLCSMDWSEEVTKYGIDIAMSVTATMEKLRIIEVALGDKLHDPSAHKLHYMTPEVFNVIMQLLIKYSNISSVFKYPYTIHKFGELQLPDSRTNLQIYEDYKFYRSEYADFLNLDHGDINLSMNLLTKSEISEMQNGYGVSRIW